MSSQKPISRREFIRLALTSLWAALLSACARALGVETQNLPTATTSISNTVTSVPNFTPQPGDTLVPIPTDTPLPTRTPTPTQTPTATEAPCFKLISPENGAELAAIGRVPFAWQEQAGATGYRLEITFPNGTNEDFETEDTRFEMYLASLPAGGRYNWKVTALDKAGEASYVAGPLAFDKPELPPTARPTKDKPGVPEPGTNDGGGPSTGGTITV